MIAVLALLALPAFAAPATHAIFDGRRDGSLPLAADPFAGVSERAPEAPASTGFFSENFGFRRELMSQFAASPNAHSSSRQSLGFETLKKFSTETKTFAGVDFQGRLVRRDRFIPVQNELDGGMHPNWTFEYHNAYADLYDLGGEGRVNARAGRFYVPFGLNLQTDTHGTVLQLSNQRDFGFERDWYAGLYGAATDALNYDAYYLAGSGYDLKYRGQRGLGAARLSLANRFLSERGLEGGASILGGERLSAGNYVVETQRIGFDERWHLAAPGGAVTATTELSGGRDAPDAVFMELHQLEYLRASRRWGLATQYRRYWKDGAGADGSLVGETTWYFRNDVAASNLHWIKLDVERKLEAMRDRSDWIVSLQYYRYW